MYGSGIEALSGKRREPLPLLVMKERERSEASPLNPNPLFLSIITI